MLREFAVEPTLIADFASARYFLEKFGTDRGRLIARFPKRWKRHVYDALSCTPVQKAKVEILLKRIDKTGFAARPGAPFDGTAPWLEQALLEDQRADSPPFDAILANGKKAPPKVLDGNELDDSNVLWAVALDRLVARQASAMATAVAPLLRISRVIQFVDPYFDGTRRQRTGPILECMKRTVEGTVVTGSIQFEVHFSNPNNKSQEFINQGLAKFKGHLPKGVTVTAYHWAEKVGGEQFHNRHILTDVGGVAFEAGLDEKKGPTDRVSLMSDQVRAELAGRLKPAAGVFDLVGEPVVLKRD